MAMMLRIYLLGRLLMEIDGAVVLQERDLRARQDRLLFSYLVLQRSHAVSRSELWDVVWPGEDDGGSGSSLKALLSRLRGALRRLEGTGVSLQTIGAHVTLRLPAETWVDVEAASYYVDAAEVALRRGDDKAAFGPASAASILASGRFLPGDSHPWALAQRERLGRQRLRALDCLAQVWLAGGEPVLAVEAASEALSLDPRRDASCRLLLRAHRAAGNPAAAVRTYHQFRTGLREALGIDPAPETERVYLQIIA